MNVTDEKSINPIDEMTRIAQNILMLTSLGFTESYRSIKLGELIYDSQRCRINFIWEGWDPLDGNSMNIRYGRLHAPNEKNSMLCDGEDARCWHRIEYPLHFLDGRTPAEAAKLDYSHSIKTRFSEAEVRDTFRRRQPEWLAQIHLAIWQHYGNQLCELFDLRRPDLWKGYQQFLKEVYDVKGRNPAIKPPLDKVC
jgi:hypothetical protein